MSDFDPGEFTVLVGRDGADEPVVSLVCKAHPGGLPDVVSVGPRDAVTLADMDRACRDHWAARHG